MKTIQEIIDEQRTAEIYNKSERAINAKIRMDIYAQDKEWKNMVSQKISDANVGKQFSDIAKAKMSASAKLRDNHQTGLIRSKDTCKKISLKRMELSPEKRAADARLGGQWHKGKPKPKYECPHCKNMIAANMFDRYHNNNCKLKDS